MVSPQGVTCGTVPAHTPWSGTGGTLLHNIHLSDDGDDCVLESESGTIPDYGTQRSIVWYGNRTITRIVVSGHVSAILANRLFEGYDLDTGNRFASNLRSADLGKLDISRVSDFEGMFADNHLLTSITGLDKWDLGQSGQSNAQNLRYMFEYLGSLSSRDMSKWDFSRIRTKDAMFSDSPGIRFIRIGANQTLPAASFRDDVTSAWPGMHWYRDDGMWTGEPFDGGIPSPSKMAWHGRPYTVSFNANGGTGSTADMRGGWPDHPGVTLASGSGFTRSGYRLAGWSSKANVTSPDYALGSSYTPTDDVTLYALWVPSPIVSNDLVFPWMNGGEIDKLKVSGTVPQGGGIRAVQSGDKIEVALMPKGTPDSTNPSDGTPAAANDVTLDTTSCSSTACNWSAMFPISALSDADDVGQGMPYVFRARLMTTLAGNSDYAFSAGRRTDLVAPSIEGATFNKRTRTVSAAVFSSGDTSKQPNRVEETRFSVTVTWPTGSSPVSTTPT